MTSVFRILSYSQANLHMASTIIRSNLNQTMVLPCSKSSNAALVLNKTYILYKAEASRLCMTWPCLSLWTHLQILSPLFIALQPYSHTGLLVPGIGQVNSHLSGPLHLPVPSPRAWLPTSSQGSFSPLFWCIESHLYKEPFLIIIYPLCFIFSHSTYCFELLYMPIYFLTFSPRQNVNSTRQGLCLFCFHGILRT